MSINKKFAILLTTTMGLMLNANTFTMKAMNNQNQINYIDDSNQGCINLEAIESNRRAQNLIANYQLYRLPNNLITLDNLSNFTYNGNTVKATVHSRIVPLHPVFRAVFDYINENKNHKITVSTDKFENGPCIVNSKGNKLWYNGQNDARFSANDLRANGYHSVFPPSIYKFLENNNIDYFIESDKSYNNNLIVSPILRFLNEYLDQILYILPLSDSSKGLIVNRNSSQFICLEKETKRVHIKSIKDLKEFENNGDWICKFEIGSFGNKLLKAPDETKGFAKSFGIEIKQDQNNQDLNRLACFIF